ncbi:hypothetical protein [Amycolatopsis japonica]
MSELEPSSQTPQHLLFSGEGVQFLTGKQRELLRQVASNFAGGRAVELSAVTLGELEASHSIEYEQEPIPVGKADFVAFGEQHGHSPQRPQRAWNQTIDGTIRNHDFYGEQFPQITFVGLAKKPRRSGQPDERTLDLRSVYKRLLATECRPEYWYGAPGDLNFVLHITNEYVRPDEPLPFQPPEAKQ